MAVSSEYGTALFRLLRLPPQTLKTQNLFLRPTLLIGAFDVLIQLLKTKKQLRPSWSEVVKSLILCDFQVCAILAQG